MATDQITAARFKKYYLENKEKIIKKVKEYTSKNKEKVKAYRKEYYRKNKEAASQKAKEKYHANPESAIRRAKERYDRIKNTEEHRSKNSKRARERRQTDRSFNILCRLRARINHALGARKKNKTIDLLGCSGIELEQHLERLFQTGMSWENRNKWHIDHIKPCSAFDLNNEEEQKLCFHYTNLQPLWAHDNLTKHAKWQPQTKTTEATQTLTECTSTVK